MRCFACKQEIPLNLNDTKDLDRLISRFGWQEVWYAGDSDEVMETGRLINVGDDIVIEVLYAGATVIGANYEYNDEDIMILFRYNDETYKKTGQYSSYGGSVWDGDLTKAKQVTKTITVWE